MVADDYAGRGVSMVGRVAEQKKLAKVMSSNESEFVAVYGRRRIRSSSYRQDLSCSRVLQEEVSFPAHGDREGKLQEAAFRISGFPGGLRIQGMSDAR